MNESNTISLYQTIKGHASNISRLAWAPNGRLLASCSRDRTVRIWDPYSGQEIKVLLGHSGAVHDIAWSPNGNYLASTTSSGEVILWSTQGWEKIGEAQEETDVTDNYSVAWSPSSQVLLIGSLHGVKIYNVKRIISARQDKWGREKSKESENEKDQKKSSVLFPGTVSHCVSWAPAGKKGTLVALGLDNRVAILDIVNINSKPLILNGHSRAVYDIKWSKDYKTLITSSADGVIRVWDLNNGRTIMTLENHTKAVTSVCFGLDETLLVSKSLDNTVRIWRTDTWETVKIIEEPSSPSFSRSAIAFHPESNFFATLGEYDRTIRVWKVDKDSALNIEPEKVSVRYTNAKVVLLGDSGVGKSALGLVLRGFPFEPQESTHGRHIWTLGTDRVTTEDGSQEVREILLWDLAGQATYRLIHQLHLGEINVALIVFDAKHQEDPFMGVRYWNRALEQILYSQDSIGFRKFLVAARIDVGGIPDSRLRINQMAIDFGFAEYHETSAKDGYGIIQLKQAVISAIDWTVIPRVTSSTTFQNLRDFFLNLARKDKPLLTFEDLYTEYSETEDPLIASQGGTEQFDVYLRRLETTGLIRRLSFAELILLQPELLDSYASALINVAKSEIEERGWIEEKKVQNGDFFLPSNQRVKDRVQERLLLIATIEDLLRHEIILRHDVDGKSFLIFPSEFTNGNPDFNNSKTESVTFQFEGAILNIYVSLVVRLWYSGFFTKRDFWRNAATFTSSAGGEYGIFLKQTGMAEGKGEIALFFSENTHPLNEYYFEEYIYDHLKKRAATNTIIRRRLYVCPKCNISMPDAAVKMRINSGLKHIVCNVCEVTRIDLIDGVERIDDFKPKININHLNKTIDAKKSIAIRITGLQGEIAHLEELLEISLGRLRQFRLQQAHYGSSTEPSIIMEIKNLENAVEKYEYDLRVQREKLASYQQEQDYSDNIDIDIT